MTFTYNPLLPWGGYGSPCGPRNGVDFPGLADCIECQMCGGCEIHGGCLADLNHIEWHMRFASPGQPACGDEAPPGRYGYTCALPAGHGGEWHQHRGGTGWKVG